MHKERIAFGEDLLLFLEKYTMNAHRLGKSAGKDWRTVKRMLNGETARPQEETLWPILKEINKGLARFGKRADFDKDRDGNWLIVEDIEPSDSTTNGADDWNNERLQRELTAIINDTDPERQADLMQLFKLLCHASPRQREAIRAMLRALVDGVE